MHCEAEDRENLRLELLEKGGLVLWRLQDKIWAWLVRTIVESILVNMTLYMSACEKYRFLIGDIHDYILTRIYIKTAGSPVMTYAHC